MKHEIETGPMTKAEEHATKLILHKTRGFETYVGSRPPAGSTPPPRETPDESEAAPTEAK